MDYQMFQFNRFMAGRDEAKCQELDEQYPEFAAQYKVKVARLQKENDAQMAEMEAKFGPSTPRKLQIGQKLPIGSIYHSTLHDRDYRVTENYVVDAEDSAFQDEVNDIFIDPGEYSTGELIEE